VRSAGGILAAVLFAATLVLTGCGGDDAPADPTPYVELDGSPRHPDDAGVVTKVASDFSTITLDDERTYAVAKDLQCFATQDGTTLPLRQRVGGYVHVGLEGKTVVWVASISSVVDAPPAKPVVYYVGDVVDLVHDELIFRDGTVLAVAPSLDLPKPPKDAPRVTVTIDPETHLVIELRPA
jgi:hypothetical protein